MNASKTSKFLSSDLMGYGGNAAYIAQDVVLLSSLTVTETLQFACKLKFLPFKKNQNLSKDEMDTFISKTIDYLGLSNCKDTLVGGSSLMNKSGGSKGGQISGGQKKRLAIGLELMSQPSLLFMDEVTSGLDATSAYQVFGIIHRLSQLGHSIIITVHQPSSRLFTMMREYGYFMMILQRGRTMYFGKAMDSMSYFEDTLNVRLPERVNPIDYYLDIVNDDFTKSVQSEESQGMSSLEIHSKFRDHLQAQILEDIEDINRAAQRESVGRDLKMERIGGLHLLLKQTLILIHRNFRNDTRNIATYWIRVVMYCIAQKVHVHFG